MIARKSTEIYLDANATTPVLEVAANAAREAMEFSYGNPSSTHVSGLKARFMLESARDSVREVLGCGEGQIVFTSGATEAIQMGVFSTLCHIREQREGNSEPATPRLLMYGATEHKAVPQAIKHWNQLLNINNRVVEIPVDAKGQLDCDFIAKHAAETDLICTMAVNNETGVITDLDQVEKAIRDHNTEAMWLVDCVQTVGKSRLRLADKTIDYAAVSGHKIYAPKGIGLLYVRENSPLIPLMAGGGQEQGARGGTENLPGVAAFAAIMSQLAASETRTFVPEEVLHNFRAQLVEALTETFPTIEFNSPLDVSVPTTINFSVKGFASKELLDLFDAAGIRVSSGSACGSAVVGSYVLEAMGLPRWQSDGAIRLSFGPLTLESEINAACVRIRQAGQALCESCLLPSAETDWAVDEKLDGLIQLKNGSMCTWLLMDSESGNCLVVDPFDELAERAESLIRCQKSKVLAVLDSHAHVDHDSCRKMLLKVLGSSATEDAATEDELGWPEKPAGTVKLSDGSQVPYINFSSKWIVAQVELPGHTQIGRVYLVGPKRDGELAAQDVIYAFSGDMILMGGIGRTDFPCSTVDGMFDSLKRLPKLISPSTILCPTHDYNNEFATTLESERSTNSFLSSILCDVTPMTRQEFLDRKPTVDAGIQDATNSELVCGLIKEPKGETSNSINVPRDELHAFFAKHKEAWIIDVREPHEFSFAQDWSELGFENPPQNVPLTRLSGFLPELVAATQATKREVIFLCRSGKRSGVAAEVARRFGVSTARHVSGGIALNVTTKGVADEWTQPGYMI